MSNISPRERLERYEKNILAPYAAFSSASRGRHYDGSEHPTRTAYQRDRDRVVHSAAFRRMEYKTQVFVNHEGDHYRTRLTHSLEVAQISRTIARALGLNEDLAESIALVHDLGHTPFGHSGEEVLNNLMAEHGGFNHNNQSLRVVDFLERRYPHFPGLNLTYEVREGIIKHESDHEPILPDQFSPDEKPTLEAVLVDMADSIAYNSHDIDDGLSSGLLDNVDLLEVPLWRRLYQESEKKQENLSDEMRRHELVRSVVNLQVTDLIKQSMKLINDENITSISDVRKTQTKLIAFSDKVGDELLELRQFLFNKLYRHPHMQSMAEQAEEIIETLFARYKDDPYKLHGKYKLRIDKEPLELIISDFIAGMTDRYAYKMFEELR